MRLLLAEDEKELARALSVLLTHSNYSVDVVHNGQDALDYLETSLYDGVILDWMMPKVDGLTVLKTIRKQGSQVPVLLLTAKSEIDNRVMGLDSGADDYLTKPFATKELLARIRAMTRRNTTAADTVLSFADLALDRASFFLSCNGESVRLANKEFQMMEMLLMNPGQVISSERFLEKIWGYDSDVELNVVWVYISYLRKKLQSLSSKAQIKGYRNQGYALEVAHD
jgi:DNA-binding response OmpR family regulator